MPDDEVYAPDRAAWRAWLATNTGRTAGVWLVYDKGRESRLKYDEIVLEALCFGWIDAKARSVSAEQTSIWMSPRRPTSGWSRSNKERLQQLEAAGLIEPAGWAAVELAKANGSWTKLDDIENLVEPADLAEQLAAEPTARATWDAFPRSAKRAHLMWIGDTRNPETRQRRIARTVSEAAAGRRARP